MAFLEWLLGRPRLQWENPLSELFYLLIFATATLVLVLEMPQQIRTTVAVEVNQTSVTLRKHEAYFFSLLGKASGFVLI